VNIPIEDKQTERIVLHLWQKALELNLKGIITIHNQEIVTELEGTEYTLLEFIRIVHSLSPAEKMLITMDKPLFHYTSLTTNVW
jgi:two-component SAPR family response regulator